MKTFFLFTLLAGIAFPGKSVAQTLTYDVYVAGQHSGMLTVVAQKSNSSLSIHSEANISVAFTKAIAILEAQYQNGYLHKASVVQRVNNKIRENSEVTREGAYYRVDIKGEESIIFKKEVPYSVALLYHVEPKGRNTVFSERYGLACALKEIEPNKYELQLPTGKKAYYTYTNGICTRMQTRQMMMDVRFELADK